nr:MAG TPA: hypothetical protein [Caudoviricetes sp.]
MLHCIRPRVRLPSRILSVCRDAQVVPTDMVCYSSLD